MKLTDARLKTYASCKHQLSVNNGCLLKHGNNVRIVVPSAIRHLLLLQLHRAHVGADRMKKLARRYIWWPANRQGHRRNGAQLRRLHVHCTETFYQVFLYTRGNFLRTLGSDHTLTSRGRLKFHVANSY